jgi:hypothetical protein
MSITLSMLAGREHGADLRRGAQRRRTIQSTLVSADAPTVELRLASGGEGHVVRRLAALDDAAELEGPVLLAVVDGDAVAGLSLRDGRVVANPFVSTRETVALLHLRAENLSQVPARHRRLRRVLSQRLA